MIRNLIATTGASGSPQQAFRGLIDPVILSTLALCSDRVPWVNRMGAEGSQRAYHLMKRSCANNSDTNKVKGHTSSSSHLISSMKAPSWQICHRKCRAAKCQHMLLTLWKCWIHTEEGDGSRHMVGSIYYWIRPLSVNTCYYCSVSTRLFSP